MSFSFRESRPAIAGRFFCCGLFLWTALFCCQKPICWHFLLTKPNFADFGQKSNLHKKFGIYPKTKKNTANQTVYGVIFCGGDKRDRTADLLNAICSEANFSPLRRWLLAIQAPFCHTFLMNFQKWVNFWSTKLYLLLTCLVKGKKRVRTSFCVLLQPVKW